MSSFSLSYFSVDAEYIIRTEKRRWGKKVFKDWLNSFETSAKSEVATVRFNGMRKWLDADLDRLIGFLSFLDVIDVRLSLANIDIRVISTQMRICFDVSRRKKRTCARKWIRINIELVSMDKSLRAGVYWSSLCSVSIHILDLNQFLNIHWETYSIQVNSNVVRTNSSSSACYSSHYPPTIHSITRWSNESHRWFLSTDIVRRWSRTKLSSTPGEFMVQMVPCQPTQNATQSWSSWTTYSQCGHSLDS